MTDYDALLNTTGQIGFLLLESGAEVYRVEDSIQRIFMAYEVESGEVFAIPSLLILSVCDTQGHSHTKVRRLYAHGTNLDKVERLNSLCRQICRDTPDLSWVEQEVSRLEALPQYSYFTQLLAYALVAAFFTLFYHGNLQDSLCSMAAGGSILVAKHAMERVHANDFFINIACSFITALVAIAVMGMGLGTHLDKIIIGAVMTLVPGVAITNFMRDVIAGDLFAGLTKLTESLLTATAIALGAGIALSMTRFILGV